MKQQKLVEEQRPYHLHSNNYSNLYYHILNQCYDSNGKNANPHYDDICIGPIISNYSCCFCYDEFPNFIDYDDMWIEHKTHIGNEVEKLDNDNSQNNISNKMTRLYWFCAQPRETALFYPYKEEEQHQKIKHNDTKQLVEEKHRQQDEEEKHFGYNMLLYNSSNHHNIILNHSDNDHNHPRIIVLTGKWGHMNMFKEDVNQFC